jgi:hypothetical protein
MQRNTHDKKSCHSVTQASLACKTPLCAYSLQASISSFYMSKAKRGWKLGRKDAAPMHDQHMVSHTPIAPASESQPYFSILGPVTWRRALHHPFWVLPLHSCLPLSHGPGFQPSQNIQKCPKTSMNYLQRMHQNASNLSGSRLPVGLWHAKFRTFSDALQTSHPFSLQPRPPTGMPLAKRKPLQTEPLPRRASNGKSHL